MIRRSLRQLDLPSRGVLGMAAALLAAWIVARLRLAGFAPVAVAEWIMARTPPDLANVLMDVLGPVARPSALLGGLALYLALGALGGMAVGFASLIGRGGRLSLLIGGVTLALAWTAMIVTLDLSVMSNLVVAGGFALAIGGLSRLGAPAHRPAGRREFLRGLGITSAGVLVTANVVFIDALRRAASAGRGGVPLFRWDRPHPRADGFEIEGLTPEMTPAGRFYRMSKNVVDPDPDTARWRLRVGERRWSVDDLLAMPRTDVQCTLRCISNRVDGPLMSTATFSGVRLRDLLAASALTPEGAGVVFTGLDGHADSIDLTAALDDETIIAYAMNGRTLTRAHGHPARLLVPGRYGFKNVKWLAQIWLTAAPFTGHWQELGWTRTAEIKAVARINVARRTPAGTLIAGVAFAGTRGVSAVRVRLDDGPWQETTLHMPPLGRSTWVQWRLDAPVAASRVTAQAVDGLGTLQSAEERPQFPDGAEGLHRVIVGSA